MPEREEAGTVRSVERALAILDLLGQHQALGLEELHYLTELPKATVSRLLHTLLEQGWLYRGLTDRRYRLRSTRLYGDAAERFRCQVVERSAPLLVELSERTGLVADLSILDGDRLLVAESSVPGVLRKRYPANRLVVGQHASLFHSAMGKRLPGRTGRQRGAPPGAPAPGRRGPLVAHPRAGPRPGLRRAYRGTLGVSGAPAVPDPRGGLAGTRPGSPARQRGAALAARPGLRRTGAPPAPGNPGRYRQSVAARARLTREFACSQAAGLRWRRTQREPACTS